MALVWVGFIGALNVNTTEAEGETLVAPSAGLLVTVVLWARTEKAPISNNKTPTPTPSAVRLLCRVARVATTSSLTKPQ